MGAKLEEKVLRSIAQYRQRSGRYLLSYAEGVAAELIAELRRDARRRSRSRPPAACGAGARRWAISTCWSPGPAPTPRSTASSPIRSVDEVLGRGENKASAKVGREGLQVDVRALPPESFGAAMQYFTGSKDHNVAIRTRAVKMGLKLSEYGLFRVEDDAKVAGETEAGVYEALGLPWIPPELRENCGEIEAAAEGRLPRPGGAARHARRPAHAHHRDRRPRLARRDGRSRRATAATSTSPSPTTRRRWPWPTAWTKSARWPSPPGARASTAMACGIRIFSGIECDILQGRRPGSGRTTRWPNSTW